MFRGKILRTLVLLALCGGLGYLVYRAYFYQNPGSLLQNAENNYAAGEQALKAKDGNTAAVRFEEAKLQAEKLLSRLETQRKDEKKLKADQVAVLYETLSKAYWIKARAHRDLTFAKSLAAGQPLLEIEDSTTGEKFRSFHAIGDYETRKESTLSLGAAAFWLPKVADAQTPAMKNFMKEVLAEAIRTYIADTPIDWGHVTNWSNIMLTLDPKDVRSLFMLSRFDFEQPKKDGKLAPLRDRSKTRMRQALDYVSRLKSSGQPYPLWRTLSVEAQIRYWLKEKALLEKDNDTFEVETERLRTLLFDKEKGALKLAKDGEGLTRMSTWDAEGVLTMFPLGLEEYLDENRRTEKEGPNILNHVKDAIEFCQRVERDKIPAFQQDLLTSVPVSITSKAQSVLATLYPEEWALVMSSVKEMLDNGLKKGIGTPRSYALFADTLYRDSLTLPTDTPKERRDATAKEAMHWLDHGLRLGKIRKLQPQEMIDYHALAADMKYNFVKNRETIAPHLDVLKDSDDVEARALYHLLEGACLERESRLDMARRHLELVHLPDSDLQLRASILLANIYLSMGQADRAVNYLKQIAKAFTRFDNLSGAERQWAVEFFHSKEDIESVLVSAILEKARQRHLKFIKENPNKRFPTDFALEEEKEAKNLIDRLTPQSTQQLSARHALAKYFAQTARLDKAKDELLTLQLEKPDNVPLLQTEVTFLLLEGQLDIKAGKRTEGTLFRDVDARIKQFLRDYPLDYTAKLYWASWLVGSKRADEAIRYLQDAGNFPFDKTEIYYRTLYSAFIAKGEREDAARILERLPRTPQVDAALIELAQTLTERGDNIIRALTQHENKGLLRCYEGAFHYQSGKYREAVESYLGALDFTLVRPLAQVGLQRTMISWAQKSPLQVREFLHEKFQDHPQETSLLVPYAYVCLLLEDIGQPTDFWERTKNMASALNYWETLTQRESPDRVSGPLLKSEYWFLAGRADYARNEVVRAYRGDPKSIPVLNMALHLAINSQDSTANFAEARTTFLAELKKQLPGLPGPQFMEARFDEKEGLYKRAADRYESLLEKHPNEQDIYYRLVQTLDKLGERDKAVSYLKKWRDVAPNDLLAASTTVEFLAKYKQEAQARKFAEDFLVAQVKSAQERALTAIKHLPPEEVEPKKKAIVENVNQIIQLEVAKAFGKAKDWSDAESWTRRLIKEAPDSVTPYLILGDMYLSRPETYDKAKEVYTQIWEKSKHNLAGNNLAWLLVSHFHDPEKAYAIAMEVRRGKFSKKLLSGERLSADFLDTLGQIYIGMGKKELWPEMRDLFESGRNRYVLDARMHYYLGYAYWGLQDAKRAGDLFQLAADVARVDGQNPLIVLDREKVVKGSEDALEKIRNGNFP